jgi:RHS repeat-associated protein
MELPTDQAHAAYAGCKSENLNTGVNTHNQISSPSGFVYDLAGNLTTVTGSASYAYNAESQISNANGTGYVYDGDGQRVEKTTSGTPYKLYWYNRSGNVLDETDQSGSTTNSSFNEYVFFGGKRIARRDSSGNVFYFFADQLGTSRVIEEIPSGLSTATLCYDYDFYPFGAEIPPPPYSNTCPQNYKFTGKERDSESGLDNFGARYMSSQYGRFMAADPSNLSVDFWIPQTWNRYSYAINNPLQVVDRNGLWPTGIHKEIINEAFPGMSAQDIKTLSDASQNMDYGPGQQDPALSDEHGMSNGLTGQSPSEAEQQGDAFIAQNEHDAEQIQADWIASGHTGIAPAALTAFGNALHTITDRLSPAHAGYQPWYGQKWWNPSVWLHVWRERRITSTQMDAATSAAQNAFLQTFGDDFDWMLDFQLEIVTHQIGSPIMPACDEDRCGD